MKKIWIILYFLTASFCGLGVQNTFAVQTSAIGGNLSNPMNNLPTDKPVFDGPGLKAGADFTGTKLDKNISKNISIKQLILGWVKFFLEIVLLIAVVAIIWAGVLYVTSFGDDSRTDTAKNIIKWVVIGIIVILSAYAIVNTLISITSTV